MLNPVDEEGEPLDVTFTSPMNRGLKEDNRQEGRENVRCVTFTSPMNRGLKAFSVKRSRSVLKKVTFTSPMNRGLKVFANAFRSFRPPRYIYFPDE